MRLMRRGFTLVEIMIVVAIVGILVAIVIPNLANVRKLAEEKTCHTNAKTLQDALDAYAASPGNPSDIIYLSQSGERSIETIVSSAYPNKPIPACPAKGNYSTDGSGNVMCAKHGSSYSSIVPGHIFVEAEPGTPPSPRP